ncbi:hypothetical protein DdX_22231 [Ditylenchus destructor]|uniref:Uncharacterized protein n=1 Tax=Ditylenchus destructor TaxID=166010 RepID=A0AAD4MEN3_9BILA|nr:hypothetical protein DdX_22231 [Ditylenchus destructor]
MNLIIFSMIFVLISSIEAPSHTADKHEVNYKFHGRFVIGNDLHLAMNNPESLDIAFVSKTGKHRDEINSKQDAHDSGSFWHYDYPFSFEFKTVPTNLGGPFKIGIKLPSAKNWIWVAQDIEFTSAKTDIKRDFTINNRVQQLKDAVFVAYVVSIPRLKRKAQDECGISDYEFDERILGGKDVPPKKWPWLVAIEKRGQEHCTGSIISRRSVNFVLKLIGDVNFLGILLKAF